MVVGLIIMSRDIDRANTKKQKDLHKDARI